MDPIYETDFALGTAAFTVPGAEDGDIELLGEHEGKVLVTCGHAVATAQGWRRRGDLEALRATFDDAQRADALAREEHAQQEQARLAQVDADRVKAEADHLAQVDADRRQADDAERARAAAQSPLPTTDPAPVVQEPQAAPPAAPEPKRKR